MATLLAKHYDGSTVHLTVEATETDGVWVVTETGSEGEVVTRAPTETELLTLNPPAPVPSASQQFAAVTGAALASGSTADEKLAAIEQVLAAIAAGG